MTPKEFARLKDRVEGLRREADKAVGALEQLRGKLKESFGYDTAKEGRRLLAAKQTELEAKRTLFKKKLKPFEEEHRDVLGEEP